LKIIKDLHLSVDVVVLHIVTTVVRIVNTAQIVNVLDAKKKIKTEAIINYGLVL
jgi:hypothetical protein